MNQEINLKEYINKKLVVNFLITISLIYVFLILLIYPINNMIKNYEPKDHVKVYLKGLITNPEVFYINAIYYYKRKEFSKAKLDIELAMGLIGYKCNDLNQKICDLNNLISTHNE